MIKMTSQPRNSMRIKWKVIYGVISVGLFFFAIFYLAGKLDWIRGWLYIALVTCGQGASACYIWQRNPEVLIRRGEIGENTKVWDRILLGIFGLMFVGILGVGALDARYAWSSMTWHWWPVGAALYLAFVVVLTWAMTANPHFEKVVRIQADRNHQVIDTGPYAIVRHPGYLATIIGFILPAPLLLGSWFAFAPAILTTICLIVRTVLEDRTLRKELPGYEEYAKRVRYRLLYGIW
jgi:protein-S-isoprenylcysteine O-methyltransferase Ste14